MDDLAFGRTIRMIRTRRRWRQEDLAVRAKVSRSTVSRVETGHLDELTLGALRQICAPLDIRVEVLGRGRGAELDRLLDTGHAALRRLVADAVIGWAPGWELAHEVSFNIYGERGVIDIVAWHPGRRALLIIELKTEVADEGGLLSAMDRRRRLAREIVEPRGWDPIVVGSWVIVARSKRNERRLAASGSVIRSVFPAGQPQIRAWLRDPSGPIAALSFWTTREHRLQIAPTMRVRRSAHARPGAI